MTNQVNLLATELLNPTHKQPISFEELPELKISDARPVGQEKLKRLLAVNKLDWEVQKNSILQKNGRNDDR